MVQYFTKVQKEQHERLESWREQARNSNCILVLGCSFAKAPTSPYAHASFGVQVGDRTLSKLCASTGSLAIEQLVYEGKPPFPDDCHVDHVFYDRMFGGPCWGDRVLFWLLKEDTPARLKEQVMVLQDVLLTYEIAGFDKMVPSPWVQQETSGWDDVRWVWSEAGEEDEVGGTYVDVTHIPVVQHDADMHIELALKMHLVPSTHVHEGQCIAY